MTGRTVVRLFVACALGLAVASAHANRFGRVFSPGFHGGGFHHGGHFPGRVFIGGAFFAPLYFPPPYYYPPAYYPPSYYPPSYYPPSAPGYAEPYAAPAPSYWYYCPTSGAYYPYVQQCPGGWQQVFPTPP